MVQMSFGRRRARCSRMTHRFDKARILMYSHDTFGLGHLRRCRTIAHSLVRGLPGAERADHLGLADRGRLRLSRARGLREDPQRHQAAQRRIHLDVAAHRRAGHDRDAPVDHPAHRRNLRARHLHRRQGADGPARRDRGDAGRPEGARHDAGAGPARRDGRAASAGRRVEAQRRDGQDRPVLRRDLGLWAARFLRPADRARRAGQRAR